MGVDKIGAIAETLVAHGQSADTPVALVQEGTTAAQRRVDATLATVARDGPRRGRHARRRSSSSARSSPSARGPSSNRG